MYKKSVLLLKSVIILIGLLVLVVCLVVLPYGIKAEFSGDFDYGWIMLGLYLTAIPFFIALLQALKLLTYIEKDQVFSQKAVRTLKYIKNSAFVIFTFFAAGMPYIFYIADKDDAPGLVAMGFVITFASFIIGTCAALFYQLLHRAVLLKSENDLTV